MSNENNIDAGIEKLAGVVAEILATKYNMRPHIEEDAMTPHLGHPRPKPHGIVAPKEHESKIRRVQFDEKELRSALAKNGLEAMVYKAIKAPVEVKIIIALRYGLGLTFMEPEIQISQEDYCFEKPLIADSRIDVLAAHFAVTRERLATELGNAPDEMLIVLFGMVDMCLMGNMPVAMANPELDDANPAA